MHIDNLILTQQSLRWTDRLPDMARFVIGGGLWTETTPLIQISHFPDDLFYVHDGHHRLTSCFLAGRNELDPREYRITNWTYDQYLEINLSQGWVTPFDPRTHCRIADLSEWKHRVRNFKGDILTFIREHSGDYLEPRKFRKISELALYTMPPSRVP